MNYQTIQELLNKAKMIGAKLTVKNGKLIVGAFEGSISPEFNQCLKEHKQELILVLSGNQDGQDNQYGLKEEISRELREELMDVWRKPTIKQILDLSRELEAFEERAAIIEFDGETTREGAEQLAYDKLIEKLENDECFSWFTFNKHYKKFYH